MNTTIRNALFALATVGALSLSACKTAGDSTAPEAAPAPASDTMTPPASDTTAPPATEAPPAQDGTSTTP